MKARIMALLGRLEPRVLLMLMGCIIALLMLQGWLLVLRQPLSDYRRLQSELQSGLQSGRQSGLQGERASLVQPPADPSRMQAELDRLEVELAALTQKLQGQGPVLAADQLVVHIIERLDRIAGRRGVRLAGVRPGATRRVLMFDEVSSEIKVTGKYQALFEWLREAEEELGPLVVTGFSIKLTDAASGALAMDLKLAAYRPAANGAAKQ